jgi:DNA-binding NtrC family response regulator
MARILVVDDRPISLKHLANTARASAAEVVTAESAKDALKKIGEGSFDVIVTDLRMETHEAGLQVLKAAKETDRYTQVIVITAYGAPAITLEAMRNAAFDVLERNSPGVDIFDLLERKIAVALQFRNEKLKEAGLQ